MKKQHLSVLEEREAMMRNYNQLIQTELYQICALRKANKNPKKTEKKIITFTVILHEVAESIDPTTTMISFILGIQAHNG